MTAYCKVTDLLVGDLELSARVDPQAFVDNASDEINSKLGYLYVVPIDTNAVPNFIALRLKSINAKIATGRLIMAITSGGEDDTVNAYGLALYKEGTMDLACIVSGREELTGATAAATDTSTDGNAPSILVADAQSGVDAFYDYVNRPVFVPDFQPPWTPYYKPGVQGGSGPGRPNRSISR